MHAQIVLCPGVNDGRFLDRTLDDLSGLFPAVSSVAVVPVGVTAFRKGLYPLRTFTTREASMTCRVLRSYWGAILTAVCWRLVVAPPISSGSFICRRCIYALHR